jgi:hypothetical protein
MFNSRRGNVFNGSTEGGTGSAMLALARVIVEELQVDLANPGVVLISI